jgi:DNA-binding GntR family transcriptional regulator
MYDGLCQLELGPRSQLEEIAYMPRISVPRSRSHRGKGTGGQWVYETLRQSIVSLELAPGDGLQESHLEERFGVSRTPVREALIRLASEGLVVMLPNRRARVAPMNLGDIQSHLEALDLIQATVCHWAAVRRGAEDLATVKSHRLAFEQAAVRKDSDGMIGANFDFHAAIGAAARNSSIERAHLQILTEQLRISRLAMTDVYFGTPEAYAGHLDRIVREHREIEQYIIDKDGLLAEAAGRQHASLGRIRIFDYLSVSLSKAVSIGSTAESRPAARTVELKPKSTTQGGP